jgi:hypothetical protein
MPKSRSLYSVRFKIISTQGTKMLEMEESSKKQLNEAKKFLSSRFRCVSCCFRTCWCPHFRCAIVKWGLMNVVEIVCGGNVNEFYVNYWSSCYIVLVLWWSLIILANVWHIRIVLEWFYRFKNALIFYV